MKINPRVRDWLLEADEPSIRYRTLVELLDRSECDPEVVTAKKAIPASEPVRRILERMHPDGYWLQKNPRTGEWAGKGIEYGAFATTHFCLAYLAELGLDRTHPLVRKAAERYLNLQKADGDFLRHYSCFYAYNIRTFILLGYRDDARVRRTIGLMLDTVRPDSGYLCDMHEGKYAKRVVKSCVRGSVKALMAFAELPEYRRHARCTALARYFLKRECLFRMDDRRKPVNFDVTRTICPVTWRAALNDILYALSRLGYGKRRETARAWAILEGKRDADGRYVLDWTPVQALLKAGKRGEPSKWVTLYALMALESRQNNATV
ncbi:MAG: hypothetical protein WCP22_01120 [Chlamydiota bacterium]